MLVSPLIEVVNLVFKVLFYLIIARCFLSFIRHDPYQPLIRFIYDVTEPVLGPFRKLIPAVGGIDFSPVIAIMAVELVRNLIIKLLFIIF
jgi:YggT family protein